MEPQTIISHKEFNLKEFFFQWEWVLLLIFAIVNMINTCLSPYYLNGSQLLSATTTFLDKAFIVLPMAFILILGDIDISVGSTVALAAVIMAVGYNAGLPMELAVALCLAVGTLCGFINGLLIAKFKELSAVIVTLSTMIIYRGIAYIIIDIGMRMVGGFMITAITILPGATAAMLSKKFNHVMLLSLVIGVVGIGIGIVLAVNRPFSSFTSVPILVLVLFAIFIVTWLVRRLFKPKPAELPASPLVQPQGATS